MKKILFSCQIIILFTCQLHAQNVGIGTTIPADKLTVQTFTGNFGVSHTDGVVTVGTYISPGVGWLGTKSNHPLSFYTNNGGQQMTLTTNGNFGIGTVVPDYRLNISSNIIASNTNTNLLKLSGQNPLMAFSNGTSDFGYIKAWTYQPSAPFTNGLVVGSAPGYPIFFSTNNYSASMVVADNGNVGIGITNPANKLQVGSMGVTGFGGNDLAIGNGTNATGFYQTNSLLQVASSTNIALMPKIGNGSGMVGINTTTPHAPLEVEGNVGIPAGGSYIWRWAYFTLDPLNGVLEGTSSAYTIPNISIIASNRILASEFDAYSDARIKNIIGTTNSLIDLETINSLHITDYTMKDKVKYGNKTFKKVIAQEVEKVYPQVVSKNSDFVPNVYQLTSKVEKTNEGFLLTFSKKHNISKDAKKLRVLSKESKAMEEVDIKSIPSDYQVVIFKNINFPADYQLVSNKNISNIPFFVYGEEVSDFRTVDYEGLTTLNISATQELSKLVKKQQAAIDLLNKRLVVMEEQNKGKLVIKNHGIHKNYSLD